MYECDSTKQTGLSIIEALVALVLLAIGVQGIALLLLNSQSLFLKSEHKLKNSFLIYSKQEKENLRQ